MISSRVLITCYLHVRRYEVFAGKLTWYFTGVYIIKSVIKSKKSKAKLVITTSKRRQNKERRRIKNKNWRIGRNAMRKKVTRYKICVGKSGKKKNETNEDNYKLKT